MAVIKIHCVPNEKTSPKFAKAFAEGSGGKVTQAHWDGDSVWAGFGSPENWRDIVRIRQLGAPFFYGDHAFFGRHQYYRIAKNALFTYGIGHSDMKRISRFHRKALRWTRGANIIICPQSDAFFRLRYGTTEAEWVGGVIAELKKHTDRKIIVHGKRDHKPLAQLLPNAHCVVVHSSNSATEALMNGVPAICLADCMARDMTRNSLADVEKLLYPENRYEWAGVLADNQWTLHEIASGMAWRHLNEKV